MDTKMATFNTWGSGQIDANRAYNPNANTYVITHGFKNTGGYGKVAPEKWIQDMANAIRNKDSNANIIITDWHKEAQVPLLKYFNAAKATKQLGEEIASQLIELKANPDKTTLIGHSLGAQASGFAGQEYKTKAEGKSLSSIYGLDKAGPGFEDKFNPNDYLDSTDAKFVATLRSSDTLGDNRATGHLNLHFDGLDGFFWDNHGKANEIFTKLLKGELKLSGLDPCPFEWDQQPEQWGNKDFPNPLGNPNRKPSDAAKKGKDNWNEAQRSPDYLILTCPLVLDLDNDGIELISQQNSQAFFDLDADNFAEQTGWVKADDGLLALDKNNNGCIDDITELFGSSTTDGFIILKQLDINNDNIINASDAQFANLRIWKDANEDGFTNTGELRSLTDWGIQSINLNYQAVNYTLEGNRISSTSTYTRTDGTTRQIVDAWFTHDQLNTYYTGDYQLKPETLFLPTLRGYGELPDLHIAMSQDPVLLDMMRDLVVLDTQNIDQFFTQLNTQVENLLYRWAGVENVDPSSRGTFLDSRKVTAMEAFLGEDFRGSNLSTVGPLPALILQEGWEDLIRNIGGRLLVQSLLTDLFPNSTYNVATDSFESSTGLATVLNTLVANGSTNLTDAALYWSMAIAGLDAHENKFNLSESVYDSLIQDALGNSQLSPYLNTLRNPKFFGDTDDYVVRSTIVVVSSDDNLILGGGGNDDLSDGDGNDILLGGAGNDNLHGGAGNKIFDGSEGDDTITARAGSIADGGTGSDRLYLNLYDQTSNLTLNAGNMNVAGIINASNFESFNITAGSGNDSLIQSGLVNGVAFRSADTLTGGAGNDTLNAGLGVSDYINGGDGNDLLILDYSIGDTGQGMYFAINAGQASRATSTGSILDYVYFSDIERFQVTGTTKDDNLTGGASEDTFIGGAGNDYLVGDIYNNWYGYYESTSKDSLLGGAGDDTISAGVGDTVDGGTGSDRLYLNLYDQTANLTLNAGSLNVPGIISATKFESFNITAGNGNDSLIQSGLVNGVVYRADDTLNGGAGNDTLNAGLGASDYINGGDGNDLLILDYSVGDTGQGMYFAINAGQASRTTSTGSTLDYAYFGGIERFQVTGTIKDDSFIGGAGDDTFIGGAGNDYLSGDYSYYGSDGKDSLVGGAGNDTISAGVGDTVDGGAGSDHLNLNLYSQTANLTVNNLTSGFNLTGIVNATNFESFNITAGSGNDKLIQSGLVNGVAYRASDTLVGSEGDDTLSAGLGSNDFINGGDGNDLLILDYSVGDTGQGMYFAINAGQASRATSTGSTLDYVYFGGIERFQVTGTTKDDNLTGGAGDDTLIGGAGNDYLTGDYYYGDGGKDSLVGGAGNDTLYGGLGNDTLNGGAGNDTLTSGAGNDTYVIDSISDIITENTNEGTDTVQSSITYTLGTNLENLILTGSAAINGTGNSLNNAITGNNANNTLNGDLGNDTLTGNSGNDLLNGGDGNDSLLGGNGNDTLVGGLGNDTLTGGTGSDRFTFNTLPEGIDRITDFLASQGDKIAVSAAGFGGGLVAGVGITADQFVLGTTALDASDRFIYNKTNGSLFFDGDGTSSLAAFQIATLSTKPTISASDITVLI